MSLLFGLIVTGTGVSSGVWFGLSVVTSLSDWLIFEAVSVMVGSTTLLFCFRCFASCLISFVSDPGVSVILGFSFSKSKLSPSLNGILWLLFGFCLATYGLSL